jgi:TRAP-type uncharacterized transport system substrate-binding protein
MIRAFLSVIAAAIATVALIYLSRDLVPPGRLVFAGGAEGGGYSQLAGRYRTLLARDGIEMVVLETEGSAENARLLASGAVDAGLLQGGIPVDGDVETLGAVFLEPVFVFLRADLPLPRNPAEWDDLSVAAGAEGSGTRAAVRSLLAAVGPEAPALRLVSLGGAEAADAVIAGEVDAAVFVAPIDAPYLAPLFAAPEVELAELDHLATLSRRLPDSHVITLPSGAFSFEPPNPQGPIRILTLAANLVAQRDLHPALVDRLVAAAVEIHGDQDILSRQGEFPTMSLATLPQDPYARGLIEDGPSPLSRFLPYWVVAQISRFAILLLPILFILVPLLRALPAVYVWRQRRRVFRHYAAIRAIDQEVAQVSDAAALDALAEQLDRIEGDIASLNLPLPYREYAYTARLHIDLIRKRIMERRRAAQIAAGG